MEKQITDEAIGRKKNLLKLAKDSFDRFVRKRMYKITPLTRYRFKPREGEVYCERAHNSNRNNGSICKECHYRLVADRWSEEIFECPKCKGEWVKIGPIARIPRKNASKKKWETFFSHCGKNCAGACR